MARNAPMMLATILIGVGIALAAPIASAFGMGVDAAHTTTMKNAGATPTYGQTWVGIWMKSSGWNGFETDLRTMRDQGVTPVIMWYYWGDSISTSCVQYGCSGRTKGEWDVMVKDMTNRAKAIMGDRTFYVVLEPEFNKGGISSFEAFDGYLASHAYTIKGIAPKAKIVTGFGHWGGWDIFDRAVAASDMTGFQILRGSTRDTSAQAIDAAGEMIRIAKDLKSRFGKDVMVFDLGISTYGGWEWVQEKALQNVIARRGELDAAGIRAIVWRYVYDNNYSSGYFGPAESTWGVKYASGGNKPAYDELVTLIKGSGGSTAPTTSAPAPSPAPTTSSSTFSSVSGNEWWIQAKVAGSPSKVEARVNGGSTVALKWQSWGAWAVSTHAPTGSSVELRATYGDGSVKTATYAWPPGAAPAPTSGSTGGAFDATFSGVKIQEWWVQTDVKATSSIARVEVSINDGAWIALSKQSWGGWAKSVHVLVGNKVEFRAVSTSGAVDESSDMWR